MLRIGRWTIYIGAVLVVVGLALGFGALFSGQDHPIALRLLALVPAGVLLCFAGLVLVVMLEPRS